MNLRNLSMKRLVNIGMGIVLLLVALLGGMNVLTSYSLSQSAKDLYDHPFTTQRTIAQLNADVDDMHQEIQNMVQETDTRKIQESRDKIEVSETDAYQQITILKGSYLGPQTDVDIISNELMAWKPIREELYVLLDSGKRQEARTMAILGGDSWKQKLVLTQKLSTIHTFADGKAKELYAQALLRNTQSITQMFLLFLLILVLCILITILIGRKVLTPLKELIRATELFRNGSYDARSSYQAGNEFGELSRSFNAMGEKVQTEIQTRKNIALVSAVMLHQGDLGSFCRELLKDLMSRTESQIGAAYLLNDEKSRFNLLESIGMKGECRKSFSVTGREGEFGAVLVTRRIQRIREIPTDSDFILCTFGGDIRAREIITIPVIKGNDVVMVLSIASIKEYSDSSMRLLNGIQSELDARVANIISNRQISDFSEKLKKTNLELQQQSKELIMQADELTEQNIELEMQKHQLDQANQLKSTFLSNMSHELRTPLNSVIALSSVLNRRLAGLIPPEEYSYLDVIERNGKNLLTTVNDILDLSRIEAGKEEINVSPFDLKSLLEDLIEMIDVQAKRKGIWIRNELPADILLITSDETKCRHIFQNIIGNAVKFTEIGGVVISGGVSDGVIHVYIKDSGIGILPQHTGLIFEEFRQADESSSRKSGGTGLGLAIARKYIQMLGGEISVESVVGTGSTFHVTLPVNINTGMHDPGDKGYKFSMPSTNTKPGIWPEDEIKKVLLVDDSEPAIIQTTDILTEKGYQVYVARNGQEALDQMATVHPDGMILDLMMPVMDGFDVLKAVRDIEENARTPILILSAKHITQNDLSFLKSNHVSQLIQKGSIDKENLLMAVENLVHEKEIIEREAAAVEKEQHRNESAARESVKLTPSALPDGRRRKILIVEDNPDNMITVRALLKDGFDLAEATDGRMAVELACGTRPDLILMDLSLPEVDGYHAFKQIRTNADLAGIPVIAMTARAMSGDREEIIAFGFDDYISKPIEKEYMEKVIIRHLYG